MNTEVRIGMLQSQAKFLAEDYARYIKSDRPDLAKETCKKMANITKDLIKIMSKKCRQEKRADSAAFVE